VAEVVRREGRHNGSRAGARKRLPQALARDALEDAARRVPVLEHSLEQERRRRHPARPADLEDTAELAG
jgi:hypothetical protein